ncbi:MAG: type II secretion system protein [Phycisphaerae bacterium]|nr:type II secretion system protein [Phycisphaerae bacterium]
MKPKKSAFTMIELLIVMAIITILVAMLVPALTTVKTMAKETQQKAQFATIEMALTAFKGDFGDYPPSHGYDPSLSEDIDYAYCGAETLAEALVGWDLLGFHPDSAWRADGKDKAGANMIYLDGTESDVVKEENLKARKGPYLELASANVFRLGNSTGKEDGLFDNIGGSGLDADRYVICDAFGVRRMTLSTGNSAKAVKAGTPILYYKANTSSKIFDPNVSNNPNDHKNQIYNAYDNFYLIALKSITADGSSGKAHSLAPPPKNLYKFDYGEDNIYGIRDGKITTTAWPHRPDSYILISAGPDGLYGTSDDIHNF